MKKGFFIVTVLIAVCISSCHKDNSGAGGWNFKGESYSAASAVLSGSVGDSLIANDNQGNTLTFFFSRLPTHSGNYQVINYTARLDSNQLYIRFVNNNTSFYYFSTGNDNVDAKVTVSSSGKITILVSSVYLESYSSAIIDSGQLTAVINQQ